MTKEEMITAISNSIEKINTIEFCPNGGWPVFDDLDIRIYTQQNNGSTITIDADILYICKSPDGCFVGHANQGVLRKRITFDSGIVTQISDAM